MSETAAVVVRQVREGDFDRWRALYRGYADFYRVEQSEEAARLAWSWIHDPAHEVEGLVAEAADGRLVGLAHFRPFARPLSASVGGWLDDLFVDPADRGSGVADLLLDALRGIGAERGWSVVRWITADDNHRARSKYDQVATRTMWVTYDMPPGA
ncbi:N-acetyltransferase [Streptomyces litmocidini]|uniref:GNAT family N-acetyltransferase n=1 Tax=Streptomyces litmocidini TaxID=67318 RepID=UPI00167E5237|nr:GNAT family N-acetyltransferase [Streptomyces litmocidini]GGU97782.1 N-acetyltransferase [Streptomyces litmocidini]